MYYFSHNPALWLLLWYASSRFPYVMNLRLKSFIAFFFKSVICVSTWRSSTAFLKFYILLLSSACGQKGTKTFRKKWWQTSIHYNVQVEWESKKMLTIENKLKVSLSFFRIKPAQNTWVVNKKEPLKIRAAQKESLKI